MEEGQRHSLPFTTQDIGMPDWTRTDAKIWIIQNQFNRRNLSMYARAELALKLQPLWAEKAKANISASGGDRRSVSVSVHQKSDEPIEQQPAVTAAPITAERPSAPTNYSRAELALKLKPRLDLALTPTPEQPKPKPVIEPVNTLKEVAKAAGVSHDTIHKASIVAAKASESTKAKLRTGETTINREYKALVKDEKQREREERMFSNLKTSDPAGARGAGGGAAE